MDVLTLLTLVCGVLVLGTPIAMLIYADGHRADGHRPDRRRRRHSSLPRKGKRRRSAA